MSSRNDCVIAFRSLVQFGWKEIKYEYVVVAAKVACPSAKVHCREYVRGCFCDGESIFWRWELVLWKTNNSNNVIGCYSNLVVGAAIQE